MPKQALVPLLFHDQQTRPVVIEKAEGQAVMEPFGGWSYFTVGISRNVLFRGE